VPSVFDALEDAVSDACDATFGEYFDVQEMVTAPNVRPTAAAADPVRVTGIFDDRERAQMLQGFRGGYGNGPGVTSPSPRVSIDIRAFGGAPVADRLWQVTRVDTGEVFEVSDAKPDGEGRVLFHLKKLTTP
jgi:hypothetical protein